jgi:regulator of nucleoside diphosphate kinase
MVKMAEHRTDLNELERSPGDHKPPIVLTRLDRDRLVALLDRASTTDARVTHFLREELDRADIVPNAVESASVVRMGSDVKFIDHDTERVRHVRLVFPEEVDNKRCVSIMSSLGSALIGLGPGQSICWHEDQKFHKLTVLEVGVGENRLVQFRAG